MADDLTQSIRDNASGPKRASDDAGSVEQHDIEQQIIADKYLLSKQAAQSPTAGLRMVKIVPPGSV